MNIEKFQSAVDLSNMKFESFLEAAEFWSDFDFQIIPTVPGEKRPAVKRDPWLSQNSPEHREEHWTANPTHEVAAIIDDRFVVFDVDGPVSLAALTQLERNYEIPPLFTVSTSRGQHHYFRRPVGIYVQTDSHDSQAHPERIDVKATRSQIHLPPSGGRSVLRRYARHIDELSEVSQDFIDAVFEHNGRPAPRPPVKRDRSEIELSGTGLSTLTALLKPIDASCGYEDWTRVGMAVFHETSGSEEGLALFDAWSATGENYPGTRDIGAKWQSFSSDVRNPVTVGTLIMMAKQAGADLSEILAGEDFEVCPYEIVEPEEVSAKPPKPDTLLDKFSLTGRSREIARQMVAALPILGFLALAGRMTVWYAAPNTGKTLLALALLIRGILAGSVDPTRVYYVAVDDNLNGLLEKLEIAEELGFAILTDGYCDFEIAELVPTLLRMAETDTASGAVVILDTLKPFVDLMDKRKSTAFMAAARRFNAKGGTFIGLAHTNKHPGADGKPVHAGTTDVKEAVDCVYIIRTVDAPPGATEKFVEFVREKDRGGGSPETAAFAYSLESGITYAQLLASVREIDPEELVPLKQANDRLGDGEIIAEVTAAIAQGHCTKMKLATFVSKRIAASRAEVIAVLEKYTGSEPGLHHWRYQVGARGAHVYTLLDRPPADPAAGDGS